MGSNKTLLDEKKIEAILREVMRGAPDMCGCVGPKPGEKLCRCDKIIRDVIEKGVSDIKALLEKEPTADDEDQI